MILFISEVSIAKAESERRKFVLAYLVSIVCIMQRHVFVVMQHLLCEILTAKNIPAPQGAGIVS